MIDTRSIKMILKVTVLLAAVLAQVALSQGQQYQQQPQTPQYGGNQMWGYNPSANDWMDYIKKATEMSQQFYKQWDKSGASNMFAMGMAYAQKWAAEAQKAAEAAMKQGQNGLGAFH